MRDTFPLLAVASVVLISGCLGGFGGGGGDTQASSFGVVTQAFEPDLANLRSGDNFGLFLEVKNTGGADARNVYAFLHGIPFGEGENDFKLEGSNPVKLADSLQLPDEEAGLPGEIASTQWELTAPQVPGGVTLTHQPRVRVMYNYETRATTTIPVLTDDEFRRIRNSNEAAPTQSSTTVTKGPLGVTINARSPVIIRDDDDRVRLTVNIELIQEGSVFDPDYTGYQDDGQIPEEELDDVNVRLFAPGVSASNEECAPLNGVVKKNLRAGTSTSFSCELNPDQFVGRTDIPVRVELNYNFLKDSTTSVTVKGIS